MVKFTVSTIDEGILYLLYVWIGERKVVKIGVTKRKSVVDRVVEITSSYYSKYRVFPRVYPKRHRKVEGVYKKEAALHRYFKEYVYSPEMKFSGSTEFFEGMNEGLLLKVYSDCVDGKDINDEEYEVGSYDEGSGRCGLDLDEGGRDTRMDVPEVGVFDERVDEAEV